MHCMLHCLLSVSSLVTRLYPCRPPPGWLAPMVSVPLLSGTTSTNVTWSPALSGPLPTTAPAPSLPLGTANWLQVPATSLPLGTAHWPQVPATSLPLGTANWPHVPLAATGFALSPASEPFPQKLVERIRSGQYVDMRDLLTDNLSLLQQLEAFGGQPFPTLPGMLKPRLREVSTIPSWIYCFLAYIAIRSPDPYTRDMLAYARLVIREAQRHGGNAWLTYDKVFRQQAALDHSLRWNTLHSGIQAATLVGQPSGTGMFCTLCREPDHTADHCALTYLQHPYNQPPRGQHLYGQPTAARGAPTGQRLQVPRDRRPAAAHAIPGQLYIPPHVCNMPPTP